MKNIKSILLSTIGFFAIATMVFLNSCVQDPCNELSCVNGGACTDGYCECPSGFEGTECEIYSYTRFVGKYAGNMRCNYNDITFPVTQDTVEIKVIQTPNLISLKMATGNTSVLEFHGRALTPDAVFNAFDNGVVKVQPSIQIDGKQIYIYLETLTYSTGERQICKFIGLKLEDTL